MAPVLSLSIPLIAAGVGLAMVLLDAAILSLLIYLPELFFDLNFFEFLN
jgi:hypothetical protein